MRPLPHIKITAENGETIPADVLQNIKLLLGTRRGEMETDRAYGISWEAIDKPLDEAMRMINLDVVDQIEIYETRSRVTDVNFDAENPQGISDVEVVVAV